MSKHHRKEKPTAETLHDSERASGARNLLAVRAGRREQEMLWLIFGILLALWLLGMITSYTLGGYLHILLLLAVAAVLIRVIQGRNPL
jgi:Family of unknown function (DUF5670)